MNYTTISLKQANHTKSHQVTFWENLMAFFYNNHNLD